MMMQFELRSGLTTSTELNNCPSPSSSMILSHWRRPCPNLVLRVVGQVLIEVRQRVGVLAEVVVDDPQLVPRCRLPASEHVTRSMLAVPCMRRNLWLPHCMSCGAKSQPAFVAHTSRRTASLSAEAPCANSEFGRPKGVQAGDRTLNVQTCGELHHSRKQPLHKVHAQVVDPTILPRP